jgi:DNA-binding NarL/FixJ family response regulator
MCRAKRPDCRLPVVMGQSYMAKVVFLSTDLMFSSRVGEAAKQLDVSMVLVSNPASLPEKFTADCGLVLVDLTLDGLNLPSVVKAIKTAAPQAKVVAFGAHVDRAALADAQEAGCDLVLTRNQFNQQYAELLKAGATV